jgi:hypothetical protein
VVALPLLLMLVVGAAFAVGTGKVAEGKGYSFALFAFVGFFFGIFGLLVAAVLPRRKPAYQDA